MRDPQQIIVRPLITEKTSANQMNENQYTFEVARDANKQEIKSAVERLFSVRVRQVRTAQQRGKWRRRGVHVGKQPNWKKAVVTVAEGEIIDVFEGL
jgi:large subunit ribosomal protein L23